MIAASVPVKFQAVWANAAGGSYVRSIPVTTVSPGAASLNLGFPPITSTPIGSGGIPPNIADENGVLQLLSAASQWAQAGMIYQWDSAFSTAVGGYPKGAVVPNLNAPGQFWWNPTDSNTNNPNDLTSGDWTPLASLLSPVANIQVNWATGTSSTTSTTFQSAGATINITKKRASNHLILIGMTQVQSDTSSSPDGCSYKMQLAQNSGGSYAAFGNVMTVRGKSGSTFAFGAPALSIFADLGTLPVSYSAQTQWASGDDTFCELTFSAILGIEVWA